MKNDYKSKTFTATLIHTACFLVFQKTQALRINSYDDDADFDGGDKDDDDDKKTK